MASTIFEFIICCLPLEIPSEQCVSHGVTKIQFHELRYYHLLKAEERRRRPHLIESIDQIQLRSQITNDSAVTGTKNNGQLQQAEATTLTPECLFSSETTKMQCPSCALGKCLQGRCGKLGSMLGVSSSSMANLSRCCVTTCSSTYIISSSLKASQTCDLGCGTASAASILSRGVDHRISL